MTLFRVTQPYVLTGPAATAAGAQALGALAREGLSRAVPTARDVRVKVQELPGARGVTVAWTSEYSDDAAAREAAVAVDAGRILPGVDAIRAALQAATGTGEGGLTASPTQVSAAGASNGPRRSGSWGLVVAAIVAVIATTAGASSRRGRRGRR